MASVMSMPGVASALNSRLSAASMSVAKQRKRGRRPPRSANVAVGANPLWRRTEAIRRSRLSPRSIPNVSGKRNKTSASGFRKAVKSKRRLSRSISSIEYPRHIISAKRAPALTPRTSSRQRKYPCCSRTLRAPTWATARTPPPLRVIRRGGMRRLLFRPLADVRPSARCDSGSSTGAERFV